jgi:large subunit ribosomal protein L6
MSRVGKKPITLPAKVQVEFDQENRIIKVVGPLGSLSFKVHPKVNVVIEPSEVKVLVENPEDKKQRALWGTYRAVIANLIQGVTSGFTKELELNGVGYKMELQAAHKKLVVYIGLSHPVTVAIPDGVTLDLQKNKLIGQSIDKQLIGDFFASLHNLKPCDPYKQKGFRFPNKFYLKKAGKKAGK